MSCISLKINFKCLSVYFILENGGWNLTSSLNKTLNCPYIFNLSFFFYSKDTKQFVKNIEYEDQLGFLYSCMTAQLFFERRVLYYNFNFVLPCLLITVLVIAGFALPCESDEKIGLRK